jgi:pimeloyl-ACP methyl ester carboxylesterase
VSDEVIQVRIHGAASLPTLVYLPGLHGDWTLVASFRAAIQGRVRFVEFTYPRTTSWSLENYAREVSQALVRNGIQSGWVIGESFSSQVAWKMIELASDGRAFQPQGVILAGGFVRYPIMIGVRVVRRINALMPPWLIRVALRIYAAYARLRHRNAPETRASIDEFVARRTEPDRQAILHRYGLILSSNADDVASRCGLPVYYLSGFVDPIVPWIFVRPWLRRHCPGFRDSRIVFNADHNVLGTAPHRSVEQVLQWMGVK